MACRTNQLGSIVSTSRETLNEGKVNSCATTLAAHFPPQTGQSNEIDNQITRL